MSLIVKVGDISETFGEISIEWKIRNFFSLTQYDYLKSPVFAFAQSCWRLRLFPTGEMANENKDWISIFLTRKGSNLPITVEYTIGIIGSEGLQYPHTHKCEKENINNEGVGWFDFISRFQLEKEKLELVPLGTLTISCKLRSDIKNSTKASLFTRLWYCCRDLKEIFFVDDRKDFTFQLENGHKHSAHKVILENRCNYFKILFGDKWLENKTGEGNLNHIKDRVFHNVLSYLYSGDVEEIGAGNVCYIYQVAHELQLEELKQLCIEHIKVSLSINTVCDILRLSEKFMEAELEEHCTKFLAENGEAVFETDKWKEFKKETPTFAFRLVENALVKK